MASLPILDPLLLVLSDLTTFFASLPHSEHELSLDATASTLRGYAEQANIKGNSGMFLDFVRTDNLAEGMLTGLAVAMEDFKTASAKKLEQERMCSPLDLLDNETNDAMSSGDDISSIDEEGPTTPTRSKASLRKERRRKREAEEMKEEEEQWIQPPTTGAKPIENDKERHPKRKSKKTKGKSRVTPINEAVIRDSLGYCHTAIGVAVNKWKSDVIFDSETRDKIVDKMDSPVAQVYTEKEENAESEGLALKSIFRFTGLMNSTSLKIDLSSVEMNENFFNGRKGDVYGRVTGIVPCSSPQQVAAFYVDAFSRHNSLDEERIKRRQLLAEDEHSKVTRRVKHVPVVGISDREFVLHRYWKTVSVNEVLVVAFPTDHDSVDLDPSLVRSELFIIQTMTRHGDNTRVTAHYHMNLNGLMPVNITSSFAPSFVNNSVIEAVEYFQNLRPYRDLNEQDGKVMGELLMSRVMKVSKNSGWKHRVANIEEVINTFEVENEGMRTFVELNPVFDSFFQTIIGNKQRPRSTVKDSLASMMRPDAEKIAASLSIAIITNVDGSAAVDEWISNYPALKELDNTQKWFRPMTLAMSFRLLHDSDYGLKVRVTVSAVLSIFDMGSDIFVIWTFFKEGQTWFAWASIAMILLSLFIQIVVVLACNQDMPASTKIQESLIVVFLVKPGVDAFRIATGAEPDERCTMTPLQESSYSRSAEMTCESIPASAVQGMAFLTSVHRTRSKAISIGISLMTTGYNATLISYDLDTSPTKRKENPYFYGYVRNDKRTQILLQMVSCCTLLVANKVLATALIAITNPRWMIYYLAGDMGLYLTYKLARRDFLYLLPLSNFGAHVGASFILRVLVKVMVDYSGTLHIRYPMEMGGTYFLFNLVMSHVSCFVAVWTYDNYYEPAVTGINVGGLEERVADKISANLLYSLVVGIALIWCLVFTWFMLTIDQKYVKTFYSWKTGSQQTIEFFRNSKIDKNKAIIFRRSIRLWSPIVGEVRMWVAENWTRWENEKPDWLTAKLIQKIPDEVFSEEELGRLKHKGMRRKSSVMQEIAGGG
jgi:hypothetical protein